MNYENLCNVEGSKSVPLLKLNNYDDTAERTFHNAPLRLEIDPIDGQLLFVDIFNSSIYKVFFMPSL